MGPVAIADGMGGLVVLAMTCSLPRSIRIRLAWLLVVFRSEPHGYFRQFRALGAGAVLLLIFSSGLKAEPVASANHDLLLSSLFLFVPPYCFGASLQNCLSRMLACKIFCDYNRSEISIDHTNDGIDRLQMLFGSR
jgi:hypothetical protein